jgi:hypothetical protein
MFPGSRDDNDNLKQGFNDADRLLSKRTGIYIQKTKMTFGNISLASI